MPEFKEPNATSTSQMGQGEANEAIEIFENLIEKLDAIKTALLEDDSERYKKLMLTEPYAGSLTAGGIQRLERVNGQLRKTQSNMGLPTLFEIGPKIVNDTEIEKLKKHYEKSGLDPEQLSRLEIAVDQAKAVWEEIISSIFPAGRPTLIYNNETLKYHRGGSLPYKQQASIDLQELEIIASLATQSENFERFKYKSGRSSKEQYTLRQEFTDWYLAQEFTRKDEIATIIDSYKEREEELHSQQE
ncbi:hypothetical protein KKB10_03855 [Patescibacteria group bacterium]|nr:hypothetical protein [Patescibacteria group bacterium]MBU1952141.1 hypothetical protein [Patescibacteria group bacterium]MBU2236006.1 hypothetical protein [Patescibacteria group bacterium]